MRFVKFLAGSAVVAAALVTAAPANAAIHHHGRSFANAPAVTNLLNRPDSGNFSAAPWAYDQISRHTAVTQTGAHTYVITITDEGSFATIPGNISPNNPLVILTPSLVAGASTTLAGTDTFTVTASSAPDLSAINGKTFTGSLPATSAWPSLIFSGPIGVTQGPWSWTYRLKCPQRFFTQVMTQANTGTTGNISGC